MDRRQLYFAFDGRIGRAELWLGLTVLGLLFFIVNTVVLLAISYFGRYARIADEITGREAFLAMTLIWIAALYPFSALLAKRLADRGRPRWLAGVFVLPGAVWYGSLVAAALIGRTPPTPLWWQITAVAIGVWFLVDLGLMRGKGGAEPFALPRHAES